MCVRDCPVNPLRCLLAKFGINLYITPDQAPIPNTYWGEPEAGIAGSTVYARADTPLHSVLHEASHIVCMSKRRRGALQCDAGGSDVEESAVCYLQVLLGDHVQGCSREQLMRDMDSWGYSFRLGNTAKWFAEDAADARDFLIEHGVLDVSGRVTFQLRG